MSRSTRPDDAVFDARLGLGLRELDGDERAPDVAPLVADELDRDLPAAPPRRSRRLVLAAALLGLAVTGTLLVDRHFREDATAPADAQDPQGPWRLIYELPLQTVLQGLPAGQEPDDAVGRYLSVIQQRAGEAVTVQRHDERSFVVDFEAASKSGVAEVRAALERGDQLTVRIMAAADYTAPGVRLDLAAETTRLRAWLDAGGRDRVLADPGALAAYRTGTPTILWFPHWVTPSPRRPGSWSARLTGRDQIRAVPLHDEADWHDGKIPAHVMARPEPDRRLLELVPVNMHEVAFAGDDFDPSETRFYEANQENWHYAVSYGIIPKQTAEYAEFSERYIGQACAILCDGEVVSAPVFESRIPGRGQLSNLALPAATAIAAAIRAPLPACPRLVSSKPREPK